METAPLSAIEEKPLIAVPIYRREREAVTLKGDEAERLATLEQSADLRKKLGIVFDKQSVKTSPKVILAAGTSVDLQAYISHLKETGALEEGNISPNALSTPIIIAKSLREELAPKSPEFEDIPAA